jgi:hypothetical protein
MNLFQSEEHARNWTKIDSAFEDNLRPLAYWLERFSAERHRARGRPDFISWMKSQQG